jgi:tetratricopeptide (TPR) repeat protein
LQQGLVFNQRRTSEGIENAVKEFRRATDLEPGWAEAWARLADAWAAASNFAFTDPAEALAEARRAARRAVEIDDKQARAHGSLGWTLSLDLDLWPQAEPEFRRAIQLDTNDPDVRRWYAAWLRKVGRYTEAEAQARAGMNLTNSADPRQWTEYLGVLLTARWLDRFHNEAAAAGRLFPNDSLIESLVARSFEFRGQFDQAIEILDYVLRLGMNSATVLALKAGVSVSRGDIALARAQAGQLEAIHRVRPVDGILLAGIYARIGQLDDAFRILEDTWRRRDNTLLSLATSPWLDNIRSDPRYAELLSRLHFTPAVLSRMEKTDTAAH